MKRVPTLEYMLSGACRLLPYLRQVMSAPIPWGPGVGRAYLESGSPEWDGWTPGSLPGQDKRGTGGSVLRFHPPRAHVVVWNRRYRLLLGLLVLGGWSLFFSPEWWGLYPVRGVRLLSRWREPIVSKILDRNWWSWYWGILLRHVLSLKKTPVWSGVGGKSPAKNKELKKLSVLFDWLWSLIKKSWAE
jgi:hypothetical protein